MRIPSRTNWKKTLSNISDSVDICVHEWRKRELVDKSMLMDWRNKVLTKVKHKIEKLKRYKHRQSQMIDALHNDDTKSALDTLHKHFVVTGADKASGNVIITCKKHYITSILHELNLNFQNNMVDNNSSDSDM